MDSRVKLSAVLLGGYLLGRTKKGGTALRLATSLATSGQSARPGELIRDNLMRTVQSAETQQMIQGLRGQLLEAVQATFDARVNQLTQSLTQRTESLGARPQTKDTEEQPEDKEEPEQPTDEDEQDSGAVDGNRSRVDEEQGKEQGSDELQERIDELKGLRITSLRKMAKDLRYDDDDVADAEKDDLARWIAEAEVEDESASSDEPVELEAPEEPEEPEPVKKTPARAEREKVES